MRLAFHTAAFCVLAAPVLAFGSSLDDKTKPDSPKNLSIAPDYCKISKIIGAKISMAPGEKAVQSAVQDNETPDRPVGKVTDLLIDSCDGQLQWAVVEFDKTLGFGGKSVAIPCDQLRWNLGKDRFDLDQNEDQLKALPAFVAADAKKNGLDLTVATLGKHWPNTGFRSEEERASLHRPEYVIDGKRFECAKPQLLLASDVSSKTVYANSEKFGTVTGGLVDRANRKIAFLIVAHGGTLGVGDSQYLVPFYALCMHGDADGKNQVYSILRSTKELEAGVRYEEPKEGAVTPEAVRRAHEMFAADAPKAREAKQ